ncbi:MAG: hypothetical protein HY291_08555 [Planctomycetes bacterium]|nr:hypothetical protein [Planctomycetota bacterium]
MVLIFRSIVDLWRARLHQLDRVLAGRPRHRWHLALERRVLSYLLRRHADAPYADPPQIAEPLDDESAQESRKLYLSDDAREQLGLPRLQPLVAAAPEPPKPKLIPEPPTPGFVVVYVRQEEKPPPKPFDDPEKEKNWQKLYGNKSRGNGSIWS